MLCPEGVAAAVAYCKHTELKTELQNITLERKKIKKNLHWAVRVKFILPSFQSYSADKNPERIFLGHWELMYADLSLTDYDMKWLTGSLAGLCWLAQSLSSVSEAP